MRIGDSWLQSAGEYVKVTNPSSGDALARVPLSTRDEIDRAIAAAHKAFRSWRDVPVVERARQLFPFTQLLEKNREELARLVCEENGKTLADARAEVRRGIEMVEFACGMPSLLMGDSLENIARDIDSQTIRQPLGVCVGITPFNFPAMVPLWMYPIAIAAGNTFVLKPSQLTPLTAVRIGELFAECGFPDGVFNLVHGEREAVEALVCHPDTRAISFVGSSAVAKSVQAMAIAHRKRVQALGGAKNFLVVMPDGVNESTVSGIMSSAFGGAGERCLAGSVVIAVGEAGERLVPLLDTACKRMTLGSATDEKTGMGPVISAQAKARIERYIDEGIKSGAKLVHDGRAADAPKGEGTFLGPTVFDHVDPKASIAREEIFGPVLSIVRAPDLDSSIELANASEYGNAASIFTQSGGAARKFSSRIETGMVGVNIGVAAPMAFFPFGGVKESMYGDARVHGKDGVMFYTQQKVTISRW
ncbi:MAG: CoA-acylating methylmalonate-semialdehyde dehydrogenase [Candidatus Eremiobacteraeota bacterium]|nr:CoA-acylating methylmalonate-semialdehyde dehydrogenase [Candidatus Eremiobacteraeota bacterium]MBC5827717.1 CoA-acylating methylmalonate-semialdehyde dehydrogenase [Candidatus Eremiobacteraeota bacterium]